MFFCGISPVSIDLVGIDIRLEIFAQLFQERIALRAILRALRREREDAVEGELADEQDCSRN